MYAMNILNIKLSGDQVLCKIENMVDFLFARNLLPRNT